ncbi:hypothetical protein IW262DRAFT_1490017 [Armillaria fumosa]|nr:hypothetical protein IW262DRAFT_1490017 [Armillaria fumosa]
MSTDLAPEALHWLFSVSSNPTVQSIVIQSIGGLPMASEEKCQALQGAMRLSYNSLLRSHLHFGMVGDLEPVPDMELGLECLLHSDGPAYIRGSTISHNIDSFELDIAISSNNCLIVKDGAAAVSSDAFFINILSGPARTSKLPPRCWLLLAKCAASQGAFETLDPAKDDHTNMFPLYLCSAILDSFHIVPKGLTQDFNSPLVLDFNKALPYFLHKIHDNVFGMFSEFLKHPSLSRPSLPQSLEVIVVAIKFLLHRLSLPESNMSHTTICQSLTAAMRQITYGVFSSQEVTALILALEDIITLCVSPLLNIESDWTDLCYYTIKAYHDLTTYVPSACSLHGIQSIADFMISHWDEIGDFSLYKSDPACGVLTDLLKKRIPVAYTVFHERQCLSFLGNHTFHEESVLMVSAYVAGIFAMQQGSDGTVDAESLQWHIDCLYHPHNRFTTCSILATHGIRQDRTAIYRDITALAKLCP